MEASERGPFAPSGSASAALVFEGETAALFFFHRFFLACFDGQDTPLSSFSSTRGVERDAHSPSTRAKEALQGPKRVQTASKSLESLERMLSAAAAKLERGRRRRDACPSLFFHRRQTAAQRRHAASTTNTTHLARQNERAAEKVKGGGVEGKGGGGEGGS